MNVVCLSIYLDLLWFLWSAFYSFQPKSPIHVLLDLHISTAFLSNVNGILFFSGSIYSLLVYRNKIEFCMFILYPKILLNSLIILGGFLCVCVFFFFVKSFRLLYRQSCHLQIRTGLFLPFRSVCLVFTFLALLHWLELQALWLNKSLKKNILAWFTVSGRKHSIFHY